MKRLMYQSIWSGLLLLTIFLSGPIAICQVLYGTVVGIVTDPDGHAVAGASVKVTDGQTGISHAQTTNANGEYSLYDLLPWCLHNRCHRERLWQPANIGSGRERLVVRSDQQLSLSSLAQTVEVSASSDQLQTDTASIHSKFDLETAQQFAHRGI